MKNNDGKEYSSTRLMIDRIEGDKVVLSASGNEIVLDREYLPGAICEGDCLILEITKEERHREKREKTAREILNELLTSGDEKKD